ncbi:MAG: CPBP family intramembrane glutamic endopeptidase [Pseudonocardiales bacterium]
MTVPLTSSRFAAPTRAPAASVVQIPQYSKRAILAVWAATTVPMGVLAWIAAPRLAATLDGPAPLARALILCITGGLIWQFVLVVGLVGIEQRSLRWSTLCEALWLRAPRSPRTKRVGGRVWWIVIPLIVALAAEEVVPVAPHPVNRELGVILQSAAGKSMLHGSWAWFTALLVLFIFNTVLGEELLFRGFLLPRMNGAFGRRDWIANGILFATYHVHVPWVIPAGLLDTFILSYPSKRYGSAWIGIVVHSAQSVVFTALALTIVL